jgi:hypothetical protein
VTARFSLQNELNHAKAARQEAEAAGCEVEALIAAVHNFQPGRQRLVFMVDCGEAAPN